MEPHPLELLSTYTTFRDLRQHYQQFGFLTETTASAASASAFTCAVLRPHVSACAPPVVAGGESVPDAKAETVGRS